jgi:hypothetical protein
MTKRDERGAWTGGGQRALSTGRRRWAMALALGVVAVLAGCGSPGNARVTQTPSATRPAATFTATAAPSPTATPAATPVIITDLNAFRQKVASAVLHNQWAQLQPLLATNDTFSYQSPTSIAHSYDAEQRLQASLQAGSPWSAGSDYMLSIHMCYAGNTPQPQVIGFQGNNGEYLMFGIEHPSPAQSYWVVMWGFEDPIGAAGFCIGNE